MNDKPKKKRISTLAKAYDVSSDVLLRLLKDADLEVKSASSMISSDIFAQIKPALLKEKEIIERKKMAKAGIKIPLKIVLKKSVKIEKKPKVEGELAEKKKEKKAYGKILLHLNLDAMMVFCSNHWQSLGCRQLE